MAFPAFREIGGVSREGRLKKRQRPGLSHLNLNPWPVRERVNALVQWCARENLVETGRKYGGNWHLKLHYRNPRSVAKLSIV